MTTLATFRSSAKITQAKFAEMIGCTQHYVSEIEAGRKRPSLDLAFKIERATKGAVPVSSWSAEDAA